MNLDRIEWHSLENILHLQPRPRNALKLKFLHLPFLCNTFLFCYQGNKQTNKQEWKHNLLGGSEKDTSSMWAAITHAMIRISSPNSWTTDRIQTMKDFPKKQGIVRNNPCQTSLSKELLPDGQRFGMVFPPESVTLVL